MIQRKFLVMVLIFGLVIMILLCYVFLLRKKESELVIMLAQIYFVIFLRRLAMKMQALFVQFLNLLNKIHNSDSMIARGIELLLALFLFLFVLFVGKMAVLGSSFLRKILEKILNSVIGAGLFCGFMTIPTIALHCYLFVGPSFLTEDNQRRVAAMAGFVTGQFVMFTSVYTKPLYEGLVQPHRMFLFFLAFFLVQLLWTSLTTLRNWPLLDLKENATIVGSRLFFLQLEFLITFFVQLYNPYIPPDSMILPLVNSYLKDKANKLLFVRSSFAGWCIGHIIRMLLFLKMFKHFIDWARTCYTNEIRWDDEY
jgi:Ycf1